MSNANTEITIDRRMDLERRTGEERRQESVAVSEERRQGERRKTHRRRQIDPTTCERDYSDAEIEFMQALDAYKRSNGRMFPTCSEILEVIRDLGYVQMESTYTETESAYEETYDNDSDTRDDSESDAS